MTQRDTEHHITEPNPEIDRKERILDARVKDIVERKIGENQLGFRKEREQIMDCLPSDKLLRRGENSERCSIWFCGFGKGI